MGRGGRWKKTTVVPPPPPHLKERGICCLIPEVSTEVLSACDKRPLAQKGADSKQVIKATFCLTTGWPFKQATFIRNQRITYFMFVREIALIDKSNRFLGEIRLTFSCHGGSKNDLRFLSSPTLIGSTCFLIAKSSIEEQFLCRLGIP
ncbi:hypothetical protein CEXT_168141 [Caerostris extrusa]|uniref:Uncharacterized protein n=1 Tax=Caerostris extrusa TaxID=172846 RepID=A0AAV4PRB1_CAEEX|nr:hypothetical protein CEXT_168141 [Caerostris extrusa]